MPETDPVLNAANKLISSAEWVWDDFETDAGHWEVVTEDFDAFQDAVLDKYMERLDLHTGNREVKDANGSTHWIPCRCPKCFVAITGR